MRRTTPVTLAAVLLFGGTLLVALGRDAQGKQPVSMLHGTYGFSWTRDCTQNVGGFDAELRAVGDAASTIGTRADKGVVTYNGDGTATSEVRGLAVFGAPPGSFAASIFELTCAITYTVNPDGSFVESQTCTGSLVAGSQSGRTFTVTDGVRQGQISADGNTLVIGDTNPGVTTLTLHAFPLLGLPEQTVQRICWRAGTAVKIRNR